MIGNKEDYPYTPDDEFYVDYYVEIRGVYDGWSVAVMKDGRLVNRWPKNDRRHKPTQEWIDEQKSRSIL